MKVPVCVLLTILHTSFCVDLTYYVEEGKSPGTYLGDIASDTHLMYNVPHKDRNLITFSQLQQDVTSSSQLFRVSKKTGKLYTAQMLDAEALCTRKSECFKIVEVAVKKAKSFMKILEIKVVIQDVNDHQPEFPEKVVNITFSEGDRIGMRKSIPNAIDRDVGVTNSQISYQLKKNVNEPFSLSVSQNADGTSKLSINLEGSLDREIKDSYLIQVIAKDTGPPAKQSILNVHISVTDINDNAPIFSKKVYNVSIENELSEMSPVAILFARDLDSGKMGRIAYHFSSQSSDIVKSHFELDKTTGEIFLRKKFTLGQQLTYALYVEATDGGSPPLSSFAKVLVNLINQQNNAPTIDVNFVSASTEKTATISEDMEVGSFIAYVKVTDHDAGQNGDVNCDLHHDKFQLQSLGVKKYKITIKNPVDREIEDHHDIRINCQDKGSPPLHAESKFSIKVMDVNDVRPKFSKETYKFWIYENQKSKISVGFINATDPDLGPGGRLTYSMLTNNKHFLPFQIADNGLISTIVSLDHEYQDVYKFQILVKDGGTPSLNDTVDVVVEVKDENDNAPYFTYPSVNPFTLDVVYYPHHSNNITILRASDSDSRENAFLKYEITQGNDKQLFIINHYTGLLSFSRVVTQNDAGTYELQFVVKDSGTPPLSAVTNMLLVLTISNKTNEILNTIHVQADDKIHLNIAIIIVLVTVTLSVVITAFMSICILRCNDWINTSHKDGLNPSNRCFSEQRHLMCPSYNTASLADISVTGERYKARKINSKGSKSESFPEDAMDNGEKGLASPIKPQTTTDIAHQVSIH